MNKDWSVKLFYGRSGGIVSACSGEHMDRQADKETELCPISYTLPVATALPKGFCRRYCTPPKRCPSHRITSHVAIRVLISSQRRMQAFGFWKKHPVVAVREYSTPCKVGRWCWPRRTALRLGFSQTIMPAPILFAPTCPSPW